MSKRTPPDAPTTLSRRQFLRTTSASAALLLAGSTAAGCGDDDAATDETPNNDAGAGADSGADVGLDGGSTPDTAVDTGPPYEAPDPDPIDGGTDTAFDPEALALDDVVHARGVQSGELRPNAALVWTWVADGSDRTLAVWRASDTAGSVKLVREEVVSPGEAGFIKVDVQDLAPDARYFYAFLDGPVATAETRSRIGRFRTPPEEGARIPFYVGASTCTNIGRAPWLSLTQMAREDIDGFLHLGDMAYCDGAVTLDEYRGVWRRYLEQDSYQAILAQAGLYATWDDHEVDNDYNPNGMAPGQVDNAKQAFFETLAIAELPNRRLWRSHRWGHTAEVFVLDSRSERDISTVGSSTRSQYIGPEQFEWLKQALLDSPCQFKIMLNSVPMTDMPDAFGADYDRWEGYRLQRDQLLAHIVDNGISGVLFLSGDFHLGFIARVDPPGTGFPLYEIAVGPGGSGGNPAAVLAENNPDLVNEFFPATQYLYWSAKTMVSTTLRFDPASNSVAVLFVDATTDTVLYDATLNLAELT